jgi:magnesium transporter
VVTFSFLLRSTMAHTAALNGALPVTQKEVDAEDAASMIEGADSTSKEDAIIMYKATSFKKFRLRFTALLTTFCLEMVVAFVFASYTDTFNKFPLLIAFQPVISAISGNVGLQCSSVNVRALAVGLADVRRPGKAVWPEVKAGVYSASVMSLILGFVCLFWYETDSASNTWKGASAFAVAIGFGMFCSVMSADITGSAAPLIFKRCGFDPSAMAGPLETAFQDIIGGTVLLAISAAILNAFGDPPTPDDDGVAITQSCLACVQSCNAATATILNVLQSCVETCTKSACQ